jgi:hypothetical protein
MTKLTSEYLQKMFIYNKDTGIVTRRVTVSPNAKKGDIVGSLDSCGYLQFSMDYKMYKLHRIIWTYIHGDIPDEIDHINGDKTDNRLCNLRNVTRCDNLKNKPIYRNNKSGVLGVHWQSGRGKWVAKIDVNGKRIHLGSFKDLNEAISARRNAEVLYNFHKNHGRQCNNIQMEDINGSTKLKQ